MPFKLTQPERLLIYRRRLGLTQAQMAERLNIQHHLYGRFENGNPQAVARYPITMELIRNQERLKPHELCLLMRRRSKITQAEIARKLRCSRYWLYQMELGKVPCDDLLWFWEQ